jgi:1-pyrroline-4-hydroxy-2-carboxylate deaminase
MQQSDWRGVFAAITTPFTDGGSVDHGFLRDHIAWLLDNGVTGIVALGSLGEAPTLTADEKRSVLRVTQAVVADRVPLVAGVSALSTTEAQTLARDAAEIGCDGLMVLPPYVYRGDWRETAEHIQSILDATSLSCMLYNNPIAYGTDIAPSQMRDLARHRNLHAVKESSGDLRRITEIREVLDDRLAIFVGMDDIIVEGISAGAVGWIAGLVNALPRESVRLFDRARCDGPDAARALYEWFLPLLRLDTVPKFVQLIKLVQQEVGMGRANVRPPRLELVGKELEATLALIRERLAARPTVD